MRIISGEHRGRRLLGPPGEQTRPVTDRVKQSIFDVIADRIESAVVYDCFAGPGSFGLESLSRGASRVVFFESHKSTLPVLKRNILELRVADRSSVIASDLFAWFANRKTNTSTKTDTGTRADPVVDTARRADLIFLDPPYRYVRERAADLQTLAGHIATSHLAPGGVVVFRHDAADELTLEALPPIDRRAYGGMVVELLAARVAPDHP